MLQVMALMEASGVPLRIPPWLSDRCAREWAALKEGRGVISGLQEDVARVLQDMGCQPRLEVAEGTLVGARTVGAGKRAWHGSCLGSRQVWVAKLPAGGHIGMSSRRGWLAGRVCRWQSFNSDSSSDGRTPLCPTLLPQMPEFWTEGFCHGMWLPY